MQYADQTTAECPTCQTVFRHCDREEDGRPYIESTRCASPGCEIYLCGAACQTLSWQCDGCRGRFCDAHPVFTVGNDRFCAGCVQELRRAMLADTGCTLEEAAAFERMVA
jgi:hypothetical protein